MLWRLSGGVRGLLNLASLAAIGILIPLRFGVGFVDPAVLLAYSAIAVLFTADFVARGVVGQSDAGLMRRVAIGGAVYGWACWAAILGAAFAALFRFGGRLELAPAALLASLGVFTICLAWLTAALGAVVSLSVYTVKAARDILRLGFFFLLLLFLLLPTLLPGGWQRAEMRMLHGEGLIRNLLYVCPALAFVGMGMLHRAERILEQRRLGLSILGEPKA